MKHPRMSAGSAANNLPVHDLYPGMYSSYFGGHAPEESRTTGTSTDYSFGNISASGINTYTHLWQYLPTSSTYSHDSPLNLHSMASDFNSRAHLFVEGGALTPPASSPAYFSSFQVDTSGLHPRDQSRLIVQRPGVRDTRDLQPRLDDRPVGQSEHHTVRDFTVKLYTLTFYITDAAFDRLRYLPERATCDRFWNLRLGRSFSLTLRRVFFFDEHQRTCYRFSQPPLLTCLPEHQRHLN